MMKIAILTSAEDASWIRAELPAHWIVEDASEARIALVSARGLDRLSALAITAPVVLVGEAQEPLDPRVAFVIRRGLPGAQIQQLLSAFSDGGSAPPAGEADEVTAPSAVAPRDAEQAFLLSRKVAAATDLAGAEAGAIDAVLELVEADRCQCLFYEPGGSLWSEVRLSSQGDDRRAVDGLAGYAARVGCPTGSERARADLRWVAAIDDPPGQGGERIAAQPVLGADGLVHAVLIAVRVGARAPFTQAELAALRRFAALLVPLFDQLSAYLGERATLPVEPNRGLFREEALAAYDQPPHGTVVRIAPAWVGWAYWVLVALLVAGAALVGMGQVPTYSVGAAVIRSSSKREVAAPSSGNLTAVLVHPGDPVERGALLAELDDDLQRAALEQSERELAAQLRSRMLSAESLESDQAVRQARQVRDAARSALDQRTVRSPTRGVVADVRVRAGQRVEPGDILASLVHGEGALEVVALLPGADRPQLRAGMSMRLELAGYRYVVSTLRIESVSTEVIAPGEARRVLGLDVAEGLSVPGPVVLARGRLASHTIQIDGTSYRLHDGMNATATVRVRSERILFALLPGLRGP
jgi:biotin carboxyl carrier protein